MAVETAAGAGQTRSPDGSAPRSARVGADEVELRILGFPRTMGRREVARGARVPVRTSRRFWQAMGFPRVEGDDAVFTEADRIALARVAQLVGATSIDEELALAMTRAFGRSADRLAVWQTQLLTEWLAGRAGTGEPEGPGGAPAGPHREVAEDAASLLVSLVDDMESLLVYVWRRHLSGAIGRMLSDAGADERADVTAPPRLVGFADLVSFTALVRRMSEGQLAALVQRFELLASSVVTAHGGRVIKTVGDEVLFVHADPAAGAAIALDLVDALAEDVLVPQARVGLAWGRVVSRLGDVFGTTVNRASRLTAVTPSGHVWVDADLARQLGSVSGFVLTPQRRRILRDIGPMTPVDLHRSRGARGEPVDSTP